MRLVFTSYAAAPSFRDPQAWLQRIEGYTGILAALAETHEVFAIERIDYAGELEQQGVRYIFCRQVRPTVLIPRTIHREIRRIQPDVVFINGFIFPLQLLQLRRSVGPSVKIIVINRSEQPGTGYRKWLQRYAARITDAFLFPSMAAGCKWVEQGIIDREEKIYEVFHGSSVFSKVDKQQSREQTGIHAAIAWLWVGRLDANKDPLTVLRAFTRLRQADKRPQLYMIFHEAPLLQEVKAFIAAQPELENAVHLVGFVPHAALQHWFSAADFFVAASHYEGGGIAALEAISAGVVPLLSAIDSFRVLTGNGNCGYLFPPGDSVALALLMEEAMAGNYSRLQERMVQHYCDNLSFTAIAGKINALLAQPAG